MRRPLRTAEIRRKRAEARQVCRARRIGTDLSCRIPCAHGEVAAGCELRLVLAPDGGLMHVSTTCSRNPPSDQEVTVVRSLAGDRYKCCATAVPAIVEYVAKVRSAGYTERDALQRALPCGETELPVLWHAVTLASWASYRHRQKRHDRAEQGDNTDAMRAAAMRRLTNDLPLPPNWEVVIGRGAIAIRGARFRSFHTVAKYVGGGSFKVLEGGLRELAHSYNGKACPVCQRTYTAPSSHCRTTRHQLRVRDAVLSILEEIGARWSRAHQNTPDPGEVQPLEG
jgi:hypothetical protein